MGAGMSLASTAFEGPASRAAPAGSNDGVPIVFNGNSGFLHAASGSVGVVLCSPWGFEDLIMRKSWRLLAEAIAAADYPCVRFDYPCTGDSLGSASDARSVEQWIDSIHHAADFLRLTMGVRQLVFVGQSLGAALAVAAAGTRTDTVGLQLIAPVIKGRAYARELAATSALVAQPIGIEHQTTADEALSVVGFPLSQSMLDSLKALDLSTVERLGAIDITIFDQTDRKVAAGLAEHFHSVGAKARVETIAPYHLMMSDATAIKPLPVGSDRIVAALPAIRPTMPASRAETIAQPSALIGRGFREDAVRFGAGQALFGVLCRPARRRADAPAFVLLNRGLNPHIGWRRVSVDHARALAHSGVTSLRIDVAGVGESRDAPGRPANLIYSPGLLQDISAAVDVLAACGHRRIALAGVCSGAFMALLAARDDPRVTDVVAVNPQRLVWDSTETAEDLIRYGLRSINDYMVDVRKGVALGKLIRSRKRVVPALRYLLKRTVKGAIARSPWRLRSMLFQTSMAAQIDAVFRTMATNGTRVSLVYTSGDPGLDELSNVFGPEGCDLANPNVSLTIISDADHNLTGNRASDAMLQQLLTCAGLQSPASQTSSMQTSVPHRIVCPT